MSSLLNACLFRAPSVSHISLQNNSPTISTWGSEYFLIIPTDGKTIDEKFWEILKAYSPDKIGQYIPTLWDLEDADPARYQQIKERYKNAWQRRVM